jgi:hypothetical protein
LEIRGQQQAKDWAAPGSRQRGSRGPELEVRSKGLQAKDWAV